MKDDRVIEIETKLAYQEDTIARLNDVVCRQQQEIDRLGALYKRLLDQVTGLAGADDTAGPDEEPPPHY